MKKALIGYTGFVGSNLRKQYNFTHFYNSLNFREMIDKDYDFIVCAGVSSTKWIANKYPEKDKTNIKKLKDILRTIHVNHFILISTIDVYSQKNGKDEDYVCNNVNHFYGKNRLDLENFCIKKFTNCTVIRLPGIFGTGIKKNIIYDLLNDHCLEMINEKSSFQYYSLKFIWSDIEKTIKNNIKKINFFTEPISTKEILVRFFPSKNIGQKATKEESYSLHTKYAHYWGKSGRYIYTKNEIMEQLTEFINEYKYKNGRL